MRSHPRTLFLLFAALASSAVIKPSSAVSRPLIKVLGDGDGKPSNNEIGLSGGVPKAIFNIPCLECLGIGEELPGNGGIPFDIQAFPLNQPCGVSNISLNGYFLNQEWNGTEAHGNGTFPFTLPNSINPQINLSLEWNSSCLFTDSIEPLSHPESVAQALTVFVKAIDDAPVTSPLGFTVSFKQLGLPELLRLSLSPDTSAGAREFSELWCNPPEHLQLSPSRESSFSSGFDTLESHVKDLERLEEDARNIASLIEEKKRIIQAESRAELKSTKELLDQCENWSCIFETLGGEIRKAAKTVYQSVKKQTKGTFHWTHIHPYTGHGLQTATILNDKDRLSSSSKFSASNCDSMYDGDPANRECPPSPSSSSKALLNLHSYNKRPGYNNFRPHTPKETLIRSLEALAGILGVAAVFTFIRRNCCTLRRKANRRARREERRAEREYRRLARRQAWRDWWYGRDRRRIQDYEEKRALIIEQEGRLEGVMQAEIRALREAHDMVQNMVQIEEGRMYGPDRPLSRTSSLPDYRSEVSSLPPAYDEDGGSDIVANGFRQYAPSSRTQWTPGSSIIALSPRPSSETLRRSGEDDAREHRHEDADGTDSESDFYGENSGSADRKS